VQCGDGKDCIEEEAVLQCESYAMYGPYGVDTGATWSPGKCFHDDYDEVLQQLELEEPPDCRIDVTGVLQKVRAVRAADMAASGRLLSCQVFRCGCMFGQAVAISAGESPSGGAGVSAGYPVSLASRTVGLELIALDLAGLASLAALARLLVRQTGRHAQGR